MPIYEKKSDIEKAEAAVSQLAMKLGLKWKPLPPLYFADYALLDREGNVLSLVEVKCRTHNMGDFDTLILDITKFVKVCAYPQYFNLNYLLLVSFKDCLAIYIWNGEKYQVKWGGRNKERDKYDREPVVHIPVERFTKVAW